MFFKGKREATILRVLAAALGIFLVTDGGTLAAGLFPMMKHAQIPVVATPAPDSFCQAVLDANDKLFTTPFHMYLTHTSAGIENGKPVNSEMVFVGGARYVLFNGKWSPSSLSTKEMKAMEQRNRKNAKNLSCHYVRDEPVNGESAAVYSAHSESEHGKNDNQIWVSKGKGLILRQETDLDTGGANGKSHLAVRYQYGNVQAPKL